MQSFGTVVVQGAAVRAGRSAVALSGNAVAKPVVPSRRRPSKECHLALEAPADSLFCRHHALIQDVVRYVIRWRRLKYQDAEDFTGTVTVRLLEDDCAVLRRFEERSSLRTFLVRVIDHMLLDYRAQHWGKWRPSMRARQLGKVAIQLETLIACDGLTFAEAAESLRTNSFIDTTIDELWRLYAQLPPRQRRRVVPCSQLESLPAPDCSPEEILSRPDPLRTLQALRVVLAKLSSNDRMLIRQRFERDLRLAQLAQLRVSLRSSSTAISRPSCGRSGTGWKSRACKLQTSGCGWDAPTNRPGAPLFCGFAALECSEMPYLRRFSPLTE